MDSYSKYVKLLKELLHKCFYYEFYGKSADRTNTIITGVGAVGSIAFFAAVPYQMPASIREIIMFGSIALIALSQVFAVLHRLLPYSARANSYIYLVRELREIYCRMECIVYKIETGEGDELSTDSVFVFCDQIEKTEQKYNADKYFPRSNWRSKKANKALTQYASYWSDDYE